MHTFTIILKIHCVIVTIPARLYLSCLDGIFEKIGIRVTLGLETQT